MAKQTQEHIDIWNFYLNKFKQKFENYIPKIYGETNYTAVIVEPRNHKDLDVVIKNVMYYLNENNSTIKWGLKIYHGNNNELFTKSIIKNWDNVLLENLNINDLSGKLYNDLLKKPSFWNSIPSENILIFQTDSILLRFGIDEFIKYDYVGAPWTRYREGSIVGNGGLSFRKKEKMIEISTNHIDNSIEMEDIYFCKYLNKNNVASFDVAKEFSVEDVPYDNPLGMHQPKIELNLLEEILKKSLGL